jgi:hypothetical protein
MKLLINILVMAVLSAMLAACGTAGERQTGRDPVKVELKKESNGYQLYCNGKPYYIRGAGFEGHDPSSVARYGGNTIRTWRTGDAFITGQEILDEALENGLMVCLGIEIARERHGFDYNDRQAVKAQFDFVKGEVMKYKDHPALLAWGIGNELNLHATNPLVWDAVNEIASMIKEIDPNHLTTTMLAGAAKEHVREVLARCPSLDFLSFQLYGDIVNLPAHLAGSGYDGAYVVSEWGATGHWETAQTEWGQPIEQTSHEKAKAYRERYETVIAADTYHCIGSFVFLWGQKQERTPTWYGMFLETGEKKESVDVMQNLWTDTWPDNRSPHLLSFTLNGKTAYDNLYLRPGVEIHAEVSASDPENDALLYRWEIIPEVPDELKSDGGDFEPRQETLYRSEAGENHIRISAPPQTGAYRLFVYVFDGNNSAATANIPFFVR